MRFGGSITSKVFIICCIMVGIFATVFGAIRIFAPSTPSLEFGEDGESIVVEVDGLGLIPGDSRSYEFDLICSEPGAYAVGMKVVEKKDGGLKEFINVEVKIGSSVLYTGNLDDMMGKSIMVTDSYRFGAQTEKMTITYTMPLDTGNEAMNTSADFNMEIIILEEGGKLDG